MGFCLLSRSAKRDSKEFKKETDPVRQGLEEILMEFIGVRVTLAREARQSKLCTMDSMRVHRAGVTAYLLYNGSATYIQ